MPKARTTTYQFCVSDELKNNKIKKINKIPPFGTFCFSKTILPNYALKNQPNGLNIFNFTELFTQEKKSQH
jgi:hypothetical protein